MSTSPESDFDIRAAPYGMSRMISCTGETRRSVVRTSEPSSSRLSPSPRPKKRRRTTAQATRARSEATVRGRRGKLAGLMELPYDVLMEVFSQLDPMDLLNLARTTKTLRNTLMHKSALPLWRHARENIEELPECPRDLSEPQYANLVFYPYCHFCLKTRVSIIHWYVRARCCKACRKRNFMKHSEFVNYNMPLNIVLPLRATDVRYGSLFYPMQTVHWLENERRRLKASEWDALVEQKKDEATEISEHADLCERWYKKWCDENAKEKNKTRSERVETILQRLTDMGWGEDIEKMGMRKDITHHRLVWQTKKLTEHAWKVISPTLVEFIQEHKREWIWNERRPLITQRHRILSKLLDSYALSQPMDAILPAASDIVFMEQVKDFNDISLLDESASAQFEEAVRELAPVIDEWRRERIQELIALVREALSPSNASDGDAAGSKSTVNVAADHSVLELATTFFALASNGARAYSGSHKWSYMFTQSWVRRLRDPFPDEENRFFSSTGMWPLDIRHACMFYHQAFDVARQLLTDCGRDPDKETFQSVMNLEFRCTACSREQNRYTLMKWTNLVHHMMENCDLRKRGAVSIVELDDDQAGVVEVCRAIRCWTRTSRNISDMSFYCIHCRQSVWARSFMEHIRCKHSDVFNSVLELVKNSRPETTVSSSQNDFLHSHSDYGFYHLVMSQYAWPLDTSDYHRHPDVEFDVEKPSTSYLEALRFYHYFEYKRRVIKDSDRMKLFTELASYVSSRKIEEGKIESPFVLSEAHIGVFMVLDKALEKNAASHWREDCQLNL